MADTPRKTLDEIRRQIDADFAEAAIPQAASDADIADRSHVPDNDASAARMRRVAPARDETDDDPATQRFYAALAARADRKLRRPSRRGGYLIAGLIGCVIGQIVLLGFMGLMRDRAESGTSSIATPAERVATTPPSSTAAPSDTLAAPETPPSGAISAPPPSVSSPTKPPSLSSSTPALASASSAPPPEPVVSAAPSASQVRPRSQARPEASQNLARAQQEVRAALSHWLGASGRVEHSFVSDAVVILGADARTARTQVPTRWGDRVVIREQRWERAARGWTLIDDRDPSQER